MSSSSPHLVVTKSVHVLNLDTLAQRLRNLDETARFDCLYIFPDKVFCRNNCREYERVHSRIFEDAAKVLARDAGIVEGTDLIAVLRTHFCTDHDILRVKALRSYKHYFESLWKDASTEQRSVLWDAIRQSGRGIYPRYGRPTTPQRGLRPSVEHMNSAPASAPGVKVEPRQDIALSSPIKIAEVLSRPRSAQAKLGQSMESSATDLPVIQDVLSPRLNTLIPGKECCPMSPSPMPSAPTPRLHEPPAGQTSEKSHQSSIFKFGLNKTKPMMGTGVLSSQQAAMTSWDMVFRDVPRNPWSLQVRANSSDHPNVDSPMTPAPQAEQAEQAEHNLGSSERKSPILASECPIRSEPPEVRVESTIAEEHGDSSYRPLSPLAPSNGPVDSSVLTPELGNTTTQAKDSVKSPASITSNSCQPGKSSAAPASVCEFSDLKPSEIATTIRNLLKKPLEAQTGAIYVLHAPKFFKTYAPAKIRDEQWVKIGISTRPTERAKEIATKCNIDGIKVSYQSHSGTMRMDLLRRIEKVCHAELNNFRRRMTCKTGKCKTVHDEWFAVDEIVAKKTVKKWADFVDRFPYHEYGALDKIWGQKLQHGRYCKIDLDGEEMDLEAAREAVHERFQAWLEEGIQEDKRDREEE